MVRYDLRGHGASDVPAGDYSVERLGRDVLSIMDRQGIEKAALAGISIGGIVSLWVATHAPDRVERLVLANTAAKIGNDASSPRPRAPLALVRFALSKDDL